MVYLKILGGVFVAVSGIMISFTLNRRISVALRRAEGWERLMLRIKGEVECFSQPICEILARTDRELLTQCGYTGARAPKSLTELVEKAMFSDAETARIAAHFASEFGRCYKREQIERCAYFTSLMVERRKKLEGELPSRRKLNITLSLAASLGALILFL